MNQQITRRRWTQAEMELLRRLYYYGIPKDEIAERLGRTKKSIEVRISRHRDLIEQRVSVIKPDVEYRPTLWERIKGLFS